MPLELLGLMLPLPLPLPPSKYYMTRIQALLLLLYLLLLLLLLLLPPPPPPPLRGMFLQDRCMAGTVG
jgi:hypothetical protein